MQARDVMTSPVLSVTSDVTVQEMCNLQNKGQVKKATLSIVGADYTLSWKDNNNTTIGQETWTKQ